MLRYIHLIIIFLSFFATTGKGAQASYSKFAEESN